MIGGTLGIFETYVGENIRLSLVANPLRSVVHS